MGGEPFEGGAERGGLLAAESLPFLSAESSEVEQDSGTVYTGDVDSLGVSGVRGARAVGRGCLLSASAGCRAAKPGARCESLSVVVYSSMSQVVRRPYVQARVSWT